MPLNPSSEARLLQVHPYLSRKVHELAAELEMDHGITIIVVQGLRTYNDQEKLYAKGRTAAGPIVTDCQAGHSWHNFGLAVDVCPVGMDGNPDWNDRHPAWTTITEVALTMGFVCGAKFRLRPDLPHLQMTGEWPDEVPDEARQVYLDTDGGGINGVWREARLPSSASSIDV